MVEIMDVRLRSDIGVNFRSRSPADNCLDPLFPKGSAFFSDRDGNSKQLRHHRAMGVPVLLLQIRKLPAEDICLGGCESCDATLGG